MESWHRCIGLADLRHDSRLQGINFKLSAMKRKLQLRFIAGNLKLIPKSLCHLLQAIAHPLSIMYALRSCLGKECVLPMSSMLAISNWHAIVRRRLLSADEQKVTSQCRDIIKTH